VVLLIRQADIILSDSPLAFPEVRRLCTFGGLRGVLAGGQACRPARFPIKLTEDHCISMVFERHTYSMALSL